jgi:E3 ubiquitin-protein ligase TRIP12
LALVAAGASENAEHMGKLCEANAVEATMSLMGNEGWKTLSDDILTVCCIILPTLVITIFAIV